MSFLNPLNWFKKEEPSTAAASFSSNTAVAPPSPAGPMPSYAGRRRRRSGKTMKAGQKAGRRHRRKHSRRA